MIIVGKHRKAYAAAVAAQRRVNMKRADGKRPTYAEEERAQRLVKGLPIALQVFAVKDAKKL